MAGRLGPMRGVRCPILCLSLALAPPSVAFAATITTPPILGGTTAAVASQLPRRPVGIHL